MKYNLLSILFCTALVFSAWGCGGDDYDDPFGGTVSGKSSGNDNGNDDNDSNTKVTSKHITISLVSKDGMSLKVKYEISSDVDYFYCTNLHDKSKKHKCDKSVTITYDELKPNTKYNLVATPYTKDGKKADDVKASFKTSSSPYTSYLCKDGKFYPLSVGKMSVSYSYGSAYGTGTNWRILKMFVSDEKYVQFTYSVHEWEYISEDWPIGTYNITNSSSYYSYNGLFMDKNRSDAFLEGTMNVSKTSSGKYIIDFDCGAWNSLYYGHAVDD